MTNSPHSTFSLAAAGDALITRELFVEGDPRFQQLTEEVTAADAAVINLENPLNDYDGHPAPKDSGGGLYISAPPRVVDELDEMGFNLFAAATNHSWDYTYDGIEITIQELNERNVSFAGLGRTRADARAPAYVDTNAGRVAIIAASSLVVPGSVAGIQRQDMQGRPGISPLRLNTRHVLRPQELEKLQTISKQLGMEELKAQREGHGVPRGYAEDDEFYLLDVGIDDGRNLAFEAGSDPGIYQSVRQNDLSEILTEIHVAKRQAEWIVVSLHAHEGPNGAYNGSAVAPFIEEFARECVDEGADVFVGHGPHVLRGVEIYDGAPLFYSLGNFVVHHHTIAKFPAETYLARGLEYDAHRSELDVTSTVSDPDAWESVLPVCQFEDGELQRIDIHPVELGIDRSYPHKGIPRIAEERAGDIIDSFADLSAPYGTEIEFRDGVGRITI